MTVHTYQVNLTGLGAMRWSILLFFLIGQSWATFRLVWNLAPKVEECQDRDICVFRLTSDVGDPTILS